MYAATQSSFFPFLVLAAGYSPSIVITQLSPLFSIFLSQFFLSIFSIFFVSACISDAFLVDLHACILDFFCFVPPRTLVIHLRRPRPPSTYQKGFLSFHVTLSRNFQLIALTWSPVSESHSLELGRECGEYQNCVIDLRTPLVVPTAHNSVWFCCKILSVLTGCLQESKSSLFCPRIEWSPNISKNNAS